MNIKEKNGFICYEKMSQSETEEVLNFLRGEQRKRSLTLQRKHREEGKPEYKAQRVIIVSELTKEGRRYINTLDSGHRFILSEIDKSLLLMDSEDLVSLPAKYADYYKDSNSIAVYNTSEHIYEVSFVIK